MHSRIAASRTGRLRVSTTTRSGQSALWLLWLLLAMPPSVQAAGTDPMADFLRAQGWLSSPATEGISARPAETLSPLVVHTMAYLDTPYRLGGSQLSEGLDCSGLVQAAVWHTLGLRLPRRASEQAQATRPIDIGDMVPGDLVFFNTQGPEYSHVGIYVGQGRFIHAPRSGAQVRLEQMDTPYWRSRFNGSRRLPEHALAQASP